MKTYAELLQLDATPYTDLQKVDITGQLIDQSFINQDIPGTEKAQEVAALVTLENLPLADQARFQYYQANAWANLRYFRRHEQQSAWDYEQPELTLEIFYLRSALNSEGFDHLSDDLKCQIYTNMGNWFSHIGRFIEAQQSWRCALEVNPEFAMALGNLGQGCFIYGRALFDPSHRSIFIYHAYGYLGSALLMGAQLEAGPYQYWQYMMASIAQRYPASYLQADHDFNHIDLGKSKPLRYYREWCLEHQLYINPLNDLGSYTVADHDILHLPTMTVAAGEPPKYHTLFNQIKQEYGTARFFLYEGTQPHQQHYADKDVKLVDTLEYAEYSIHMEKVKIAFRLIYSLFDKIGYLLNDYLQIGLRRKQVSFKNLWHDQKRLRPQFINNNNLALRGLYWLSKDLFNTEDAHEAVLEPDAKELAEIRNHIEHKSFKVVQYGSWGGDDADGYTYSIDRGKFERKTLKLMRLVRSAIIYTALIIHHEEEQKPKTGLSMPITLPDLPYRDKV